MKLRARIALVTLAVTAPLLGVLVFFDVVAQQRAAEGELRELVLARTELPEERARCEADPQIWRHGPELHKARAVQAGEPGPHPPPMAADDEPPSPASGPRTGAEQHRPPTPLTLPAPRAAAEPHGPLGPPTRGPAPPQSVRAGVRGPHRAPAEFLAYDARLTSQLHGAPQLDPAELAWRADGSASLSSVLHPDRVAVVVRTPWPGGACAYVLGQGTTEPWLGALLPPTRIWALPAFMVFAVVLLAIGPVVRRIRTLTRAVQSSAAAGYTTPPLAAGHDEISELAAAFARAAAEVRAQLDAKDRRDQALRNFVADTSHDVAIPLTVLQGQLVELQERAEQGRQVELTLLRSAMDEAHYIGALLHNLGAAAKLEALDDELRLQYGDVDLGALLSRVVSRHRPLARQRDIELEMALPEEILHVRADVTLLEQAISNVVYNAVRHNRAGGHVAVLLEAEPNPNAFRVSVVDDGPGIDPQQLAALNQRSERGTAARTRGEPGHGLGLHITRRALGAHGMALRLSASEAGGLCAEIEGVCDRDGGSTHG